MVEKDIMTLQPPLTIKRYDNPDFHAVWALHKLALESVGAYVDAPEFDEDLNDIEGIYLHDDGEFLVGLLGDMIVAMGALRKRDAQCAEIKRMRVHPDYQRRGYGQRVLDALEAAAVRLGYSQLYLDTTLVQHAAQGLYEKNGYEAVDRSGARYGFDYILYWKNL